MKLTIYFDGSYWCGLIEYVGVAGDYRACNYLFGAEPKNPEVEAFICQQLSQVVLENDRKLATSVKTGNIKKEKKVSLKKMQRKINKLKKQPALSTKAQLAMKEAQEQFKVQKRKQTKQQKAQQKEAQFLLKQEKRLQKKKGH
ncbi:YjdF family protein [Enterococcus sp. LJL90]